VIHEVKKSSKIEEAAMWQLKFYILYLRQFGIDTTGQIHIPEEKKKMSVELTEEDEQKLFDIIKDIQVILGSPKAPERLASGKCGKCAYYEFCFAE
jgi:CRISPR-associated exonuclease Cas4